MTAKQKRKLVSKIYDDVMTLLTAVLFMGIIGHCWFMAVITY